MSLLSVDKLAFRYAGGPLILDGISLQVASPEVIAIIGPNGAGKSTLLDLIAGQKQPLSGTCRVSDRDIRTIDRGEFCRMVTHVPQQVPSRVPFTVEQVVLTGRTPHSHGLYESDKDLAAAEQALERTGVASLRHRGFSSLSGGEKQRVLIAAALCQQPSILLLDEPGAHLDPRNEAWLWALLRELKHDGCLTIVVTHHIALAAQHSDRIWLLHRGRIVTDSPPVEALQPVRLTEVFEVPFHRYDSPEGRVFLSYGN